jgi:hypothetical protein
MPEVEMVKKSLIACVAAVLLAGTATARITEIESWRKETDGVVRETTVLCIDGQKYVFVFGNGTGTAASLIQVFEEQDGRIVPAPCPPVKFVPPEKN